MWTEYKGMYRDAHLSAYVDVDQDWHWTIRGYKDRENHSLVLFQQGVASSPDQAYELMCTITDEFLGDNFMEDME